MMKMNFRKTGPLLFLVAAASLTGCASAPKTNAMLDEARAAGEPEPKKPRRKNPVDPRHFKSVAPQALILCPTRELAQQVASDAIDLVQYIKGVRIASIIGGLPYAQQVARLQNAVLVVATSRVPPYLGASWARVATAAAPRVRPTLRRATAAIAVSFMSCLL